MKIENATPSSVSEHTRQPQLKSGRVWRAMFENLPDMAAITDSHGTILCANKAFMRAIGSSTEQLPSMNISQLMSGLPDFTQLSGVSGLVQTTMGPKSTNAVPVETSLTPVEVSGRPLVIIVGRIRHEQSSEQQSLRNMIQELLQTNATLTKQAEIDPLTEVLNRRGLERVLTREEALSQRQSMPLCCALIDVDDFKSINDSYGHAAGDLVLKNIADRIKRSLRVYDYVARIGGDEFMVLMPNTASGQAGIVMERVLGCICSEPVVTPFNSISITASCGLSVVSPQERSIANLLSITRMALKRSKASGKNRVSIADNSPCCDEQDSVSRAKQDGFQHIPFYLEVC